MTTLRNSVGERIRAIRKAKGLTQQQLAELSGLDDAYVGSLERGERNFSIDTLEKIIIGLKVSPYDVLSRDYSENEELLLRRRAVDEYSSLINDISIKDVDRIKRMIKELEKF